MLTAENSCCTNFCTGTASAVTGVLEKVGAGVKAVKEGDFSKYCDICCQYYIYTHIMSHVHRESFRSHIHRESFRSQ